jgi:hypothetical protein
VLLGFQQIVFIPAQNKWFKKKDSWLFVMKPEREDKLCEKMVMRLSVLSLHKITDNIIFIPLPRPAGPTSPFHYCLSFPFLIFNYIDPPGVDPG